MGPQTPSDVVTVSCGVCSWTSANPGVSPFSALTVDAAIP